MISSEDHPRLVDVVSIHPLDENFNSKSYCLETKSLGYWKVSGSLCAILSLMNGERSISDIVNICNHDYSISVSKRDLHELIEKKLRPMGLLDGGESSHDLPRRKKPAGLMRAKLIPANLVNRISAHFKVLFSPPVMRTLVAACLLFHLLFYFVHPPYGMLTLLISNYENVIPYAILLGLVHEFGHASASEHFNIKSGAIGIGLYYVFPVFWNDLNKTWKLPKRHRAVVDMGGIYFQLIAGSLMILFSLVSGWKWVLGFVVFNSLSILYSMIPLIRFDGYWFLSDTLGIPNLQTELIRAVKQLLRFIKPEIHRKFENPKVRVFFYCYLSLWSIALPLLIYVVLKRFVIIAYNYPSMIQAFLQDIEKVTLNQVPTKLVLALRITLLPLYAFLVLVIVRAKIVGSIVKSPRRNENIVSKTTG